MRIHDRQALPVPAHWSSDLQIALDAIDVWAEVLEAYHWNGDNFGIAFALARSYLDHCSKHTEEPTLAAGADDA